MIHDVKITPLRIIPDNRGKVMHMLRTDSEVFSRFGEIYFSTVFYNSIKAWHLHKESTLNYFLVTIPPLIWNGFKGIGKTESIIANCLTIPHDEREMVRKDPSDKKFNYNWK